MNEMKQMEAPVLMRGVLTVKDKKYLTPHYIRVILEGEDIPNYKFARVGDNNKIVIPIDKSNPFQLPESPMAMRSQEGSEVPQIRTYTMRSLDTEKGEMAIDFVAHGENGAASKWAINAEQGDQLGVLMKQKSKPLFSPADWYLITGDHTALPVISVILESLPKDARGKAVIEVYSPEDVLALEAPENIELHWNFNDRPGEKSTLTSLFDAVKLPAAGSKYIFAAAEYTAIKQIQHSLQENPALESHDWYAYSYWKYGQAEDASSGKRRELSRNR